MRYLDIDVTQYQSLFVWSTYDDNGKLIASGRGRKENLEQNKQRWKNGEDYLDND